MNRREAVVGLGAAAIPLMARAQQSLRPDSIQDQCVLQASHSRFAPRLMFALISVELLQSEIVELTPALQNDRSAIE